MMCVLEEELGQFGYEYGYDTENARQALQKEIFDSLAGVGVPMITRCERQQVIAEVLSEELDEEFTPEILNDLVDDEFDKVCY